MAIRGGDWLASVPRGLVLIYAGLLLTLAGVTLQTANFGQELGRDFGLKLLFQLRGALPPPDGVSVVSINDSAAQRIGLPAPVGPYQRCEDLRIGALPETHRPLPPASRVADWPRCIHARLVDALRVMGARTIVFDLTFRERDPFIVDGEDVRATQDDQLAAAMHRSKNVFLANKVYETLDQANPQLSSDLSNINAATLTQTIRREALGVGPFHIADVKPPYGRVYLYSTPDTPRPSVLVLAMLFQLRQVYPDLLRNIPGATSAAWGLPVTQADLFMPGELEATTIQLRQLLRAPSNGAPSFNANQVTKGADLPTRRWISALASEPVIQTNFYGPPGTLDTVSYEEVLLPVVSEGTKKKIHGRAVFIGYSETGRPEQLDHFESYFARGDGVHFSGVEFAATLFANLLDGSELRRAPTALALFIVALFAFVPLGITLYWPTPLGFIAAAGTGAGYLVAASVLFRTHNSWLPIIVPLGMVLPAGLLISFAWQAFQQTLRSRELEAFLGRLLPREVVERIRQNARRLRSPSGPHSGACIATDAAGFSSISEQLSSETLVKLMDRYFSTMTRQVARRDGIVSNIAGDEMIAVWANEGNDATNCRQACEASLGILDAVARFNAHRPRTPLPTRIGVHWGPLTFGSLENQAPLGAFGDTVNTATRIQNLNKTLRTTLLVSLPAFQSTEDYLARDLGLFTFRGKTIPTRIFELAGRTNTATSAQRRLYAEFAVALSACKNNRLEEGLRLFRELLKDFPDDGPTAFYVQYIAEHPDWNGQPIPAG